MGNPFDPVQAFFFNQKYNLFPPPHTDMLYSASRTSISLIIMMWALLAILVCGAKARLEKQNVAMALHNRQDCKTKEGTVVKCVDPALKSGKPYKKKHDWSDEQASGRHGSVLLTNGDPDEAEVPFSKETKDLALAQTEAARKLLYFPNQLVTDEISGAAGVLGKVYKDLLTKEVPKIEWDTNCEIKKQGSEEKDERKCFRSWMGTRLLGSQGLLNGKTPEDLDQMLHRLNKKTGTARDRSAFVALLGDLGALWADTGATTGLGGGRSPKDNKEMRKILAKFLKQYGCEAPSQATVDRVQHYGGSGAVGPVSFSFLFLFLFA